MKSFFKDVLQIKNGRNQKAVENSNGMYPIYGSGGIMGRANDYICKENTVIVGRKGSINNPIFVEEPFWNVDTAFGLEADEMKLLPRYLYYFCLHFDFERLNKAVTIPSLTKSDLLKIQIDVPDLITQANVVRRLCNIENIIAFRKQQLTDLDMLIKARFVEMFGVLGADEFGWGLLTLGSVCDINPKKGQDTRLGNGVEVSFVPMPAVTEHGEIDASTIKEYDEVKTGFTYFAENDVLFAKITPCMENGKGAVAKGLHNGIGFGSTEFHVLRPINGKTNPYWIYMLTTFSQFRADAANNMTGSAGQRRVPVSFLENYRVAVPPIDFQNQFADFYKQVDKLRVATQKSLDKTQELFDCLMQEYFG